MAFATPREILCAIAVNTLILLLGVRWFLFDTPSTRNGSVDTPSPLSWAIPQPPEQVLMNMIHLSVRYELESPSWAHQLPPGGHVVHLPDPFAENATETQHPTEGDIGGMGTYTVALFHQLKCLEILRDAYLDEGSHRTAPLPSHCLNYIRQTLLCNNDLGNELSGVSKVPSNAVRAYDAVCWDWEPVFVGAEKNWEEYAALRAAEMQ